MGLRDYSAGNDPADRARPEKHTVILRIARGSSMSVCRVPRDLDLRSKV